MFTGDPWQISRIWLWNDVGLGQIGPLGMFLPIGFYGVYMAVFSLSVWTMHWDGKRFSGIRWVVVITYVLATLHIAAIITDAGGHISVFPFLVTHAWRRMSACVCCSLSDSVLAWRCYVIFGKRRWLKWTLTIVVLAVTVSGIFSGILIMFQDWELIDGQTDGPVTDVMNLVNIPTTLTWAVCSLVLNTVLSSSIVAKIVIVSRQTNRHLASSRSIPLARAFIESSLMSWIALVVYTGLYVSTTVLPQSDASVMFVGYQVQSALLTILPLIFGISQALVIARLGVSRFAGSTSFKDTIVALTSDDHDASVRAARSCAVACRDVESQSDHE